MRRKCFSLSIPPATVAGATAALVLCACMGADHDRASSQSAVPEPVTITVDKDQYQPGDTAAITVRNGSSHPIWFLDAERGGRNPWWGLHRYEGGGWKEVTLWKPTRNKCVVVVSEPGPIEESVRELGAGAERADRWTLTNCLMASVVGPKMELTPIEPGRYRLFFRYGADRRSWDSVTVYSREFMVGVGK